jgi:hypothetical protein
LVLVAKKQKEFERISGILLENCIDRKSLTINLWIGVSIENLKKVWLKFKNPRPFLPYRQAHRIGLI